MPAVKKTGTLPDIDSFNFTPGRIIAKKYEIISLLGAGWEGEVYKIVETRTGIERAAKFFFPKRNIKDSAAKFYAKKLHKLRQCPILIQYHHQETITFRNQPITCLISEFVDGDMLSDFVARQPGKRLSVYEGLHLLHAIASGMDCIHRHREYHGDLHDGNVMIKRRGLEFDIKILDLFYMTSAKSELIQTDVNDMVRIFYDCIGGAKHYAKHPPQVKDICNGLKQTLIRKKFRTAGQLQRYLENMEWD